MQSLVAKLRVPTEDVLKPSLSTKGNIAKFHNDNGTLETHATLQIQIYQPCLTIQIINDIQIWKKFHISLDQKSNVRNILPSPTLWILLFW